jgi:formate dehydrogenase maturation protein FdhE
MAEQAARADTPRKTLTSTEEHGPMGGCPNCASTDLVSIDMTLRGEGMRFSHCRRCEHRWWTDTSRGVPISLAEVLSRA